MFQIITLVQGLLSNLPCPGYLSKELKSIFMFKKGKKRKVFLIICHFCIMCLPLVFLQSAYLVAHTMMKQFNASQCIWKDQFSPIISKICQSSPTILSFGHNPRSAFLHVEFRFNSCVCGIQKRFGN